MVEDEYMKITPTKMLDALNRSGYLLESEIAKLLTKKGWFVETNVVIQDKVTKKDREVDMTADFYRRERLGIVHRTIFKINLVFEIKSNAIPLVLLTELNYTYNIEPYVALKFAKTDGEKYDYQEIDFHTEFLCSKNVDVFTQYCSFQFKKEKIPIPGTPKKYYQELMALHPDDLHDSIQKVIQWCDESVESWESFKKKDSNNPYFRHFFYLPILLINDDLYELHIIKKKKPHLKKVNFSILYVNYHYDEKPTSAYVFVVTKAGLDDLLDKLLKYEIQFEKLMVESKQRYEIKIAKKKALKKDDSKS
jgi:hypothetical protein